MMTMMETHTQKQKQTKTTWLMLTADYWWWWWLEWWWWWARSNDVVGENFHDTNEETVMIIQKLFFCRLDECSRHCRAHKLSCERSEKRGTYWSSRAATIVEASPLIAMGGVRVTSWRSITQMPHSASSHHIASAYSSLPTQDRWRHAYPSTDGYDACFPNASDINR